MIDYPDKDIVIDLDFGHRQERLSVQNKLKVRDLIRLIELHFKCSVSQLKINGRLMNLEGERELRREFPLLNGLAAAVEASWIQGESDLCEVHLDTKIAYCISCTKAYCSHCNHHGHDTIALKQLQQLDFLFHHFEYGAAPSRGLQDRGSTIDAKMEEAKTSIVEALQRLRSLQASHLEESKERLAIELRGVLRKELILLQAKEDTKLYKVMSQYSIMKLYMFYSSNEYEFTYHNLDMLVSLLKKMRDENILRMEMERISLIVNQSKAMMDAIQLEDRHLKEMAQNYQEERKKREESFAGIAQQRLEQITSNCDHQMPSLAMIDQTLLPNLSQSQSQSKRKEEA